MKPEIYIIGGPNGAGKTTSAFKILPTFLSINEFINADLIATGLSAFNQSSVSFEAGRLMLMRIDELIRLRKSFAFETTLASKTFFSILQNAKKLGYSVSVIYIWLSSPSLAFERVKLRFEKGGHFVDEETVHRRYERGRKNLNNLYESLTDSWQIFDNSDNDIKFIAGKDRNGLISIIDESVYRNIKEQL